MISCESERVLNKMLTTKGKGDGFKTKLAKQKIKPVKVKKKGEINKTYPVKS